MADTDKITAEEKAAINKGLTKIIGKLVLPLMLAGLTGGGFGSWISGQNTASKADVDRIEKAVTEGFDSAAKEREAMAERVRLNERELDRRGIKIDTLERDLAEAKKRIEKLERP